MSFRRSRLDRSIDFGRGVRAPSFDSNAPLAWDPSSLTDLRAWLRADTVTLVGPDVDSWTDLSGNGNDFTAPTAADRPAYNAIDADFNGEPSVQGDGTTEHLLCSPMSWGASVDAFGMFTAHAGDLNTNDQPFNWNSNISIRTLGPNFGARTLGAGGTETTAADANDGAARWFGFTWDGASQSVYVDGTTALSSSASSPSPYSDGGDAGLFATFIDTSHWSGKLAELALMRAEPSSAELAEWDSYVVRYGL